MKGVSSLGNMVMCFQIAVFKSLAGLLNTVHSFSYGGRISMNYIHLSNCSEDGLWNAYACVN